MGGGSRWIRAAIAVTEFSRLCRRRCLRRARAHKSTMARAAQDGRPYASSWVITGNGHAHATDRGLADLLRSLAAGWPALPPAPVVSPGVTTAPTVARFRG